MYLLSPPLPDVFVFREHLLTYNCVNIVNFITFYKKIPGGLHNVHLNVIKTTFLVGKI